LSMLYSLSVVPKIDTQDPIPTFPIELDHIRNLKTPLKCTLCGITYDVLARLFDINCISPSDEFNSYYDEDKGYRGINKLDKKKKVKIIIMADMQHSTTTTEEIS